MKMLRVITWVALATSLAFALGEASAQHYPSGPAYRPAPPPTEPADEPDMYAPAPPGNYVPPPAQSMYPGQQQPYGQRQASPAPAPGTSFPAPADYPWMHDRNAANAPAPYDNQPAEPAPYRSGHMFGSPDAPRPPGSIEAAPNAPAARDNQGGTTVASLPPDIRPEQPDERTEVAAQFKRQVVPYQTTEPPGTLIVDTPNTYLYLVLGHGQAMRYGIGVGREGFTWTGTERISRMKEWPDWFPPKEMIDRQPYLPRFMAGGPSNPLGARALYLGHTLYRIHGTNQPSTIGTFVSSGCIRLVNEDIEDLYNRVQVGTRVVVLPGANQPPATAAARPATAVH
jgi:lipoprotein-anchoring transpeptidase ErfK/SrfK